MIADLRLNYEKSVEQNEHLQVMLDMNTKSRLLLGCPNGGGDLKNGDTPMRRRVNGTNSSAAK